MKEEVFWELIERVFHMPIDKIYQFGYDQLQNDIITDYLIKNGLESAKAFHEILSQKIRTLFLPKIGELFLITGYDLSEEITKDFKYISVDGFVDFRAWIVSLGKENFERILNFTSEHDILEFDFDANTSFREDLVYLTSSVIENMGEDNELDYFDDEDMAELFSLMEWDNANEKYPLLFKLHQDRFKSGYYN